MGEVFVQYGFKSTDKELNGVVIQWVEGTRGCACVRMHVHVHLLLGCFNLFRLLVNWMRNH